MVPAMPSAEIAQAILEGETIANDLAGEGRERLVRAQWEQEEMIRAAAGKKNWKAGGKRKFSHKPARNKGNEQGLHVAAKRG